MKILIIGGSRFMGPPLIKLLLSSGHDVTIFNRGNFAVPSEGLRAVAGDRDKGIGIKGKFDAVVDMCAYKASQTASLLKEVDFDYLLHMSTAAVYRKPETYPITENHPLGLWDIWGPYNMEKVGCEEILARSGVKYGVVRPVYVLGPNNYHSRESYIYGAILSGQEITLPGSGKTRAQFIFADEVADLMVTMIEGKVEGAFNACGDDVVHLGDLLTNMGRVVGKAPKIKYDPEMTCDFERLWFSGDDFYCSNDKAKTLGWEPKGLAENLRIDWDRHYRII